MVRSAKFFQMVFMALLLVAAMPAEARTLRLVMNWDPARFREAAYTLQFIEQFNASERAKAADLRIEFIGGPDITPAADQLAALGRGEFELLFGEAGRYVNDVPAAYALYATVKNPMQARRSGAISLIDGSYIRRANVHLLGWLTGGVGYNLWLRDLPKLNDLGMPSLTGVRINSSDFYNSWLQIYDADFVDLPPEDIYGEWQRGELDGAVWPALGLDGLGFSDFSGYRIDPPVWQLVNMLWVNFDTWLDLDGKQRNTLARALIDFEPIAFAFYNDLAKKERAEVTAKGIKSLYLSGVGGRAFLLQARSVMWGEVQLKSRYTYPSIRRALPH